MVDEFDSRNASTEVGLLNLRVAGFPEFIHSWIIFFLVGPNFFVVGGKCFLVGRICFSCRVPINFSKLSRGKFKPCKFTRFSITRRSTMVEREE